ncbi:zinc finger MYM-type protein 1-like [Brassica napus]|uniref:zinc finger MYM-type protein 1-like n=1 Tax=Brassica napus TaxID=3708 RepID=UPI002078525D|nr:zinc finger MYM-type protein 1-like [Brassica napus]
MERYYNKTSASDSKRNLDKLDNSDDLDSLPWDPAERKKISQYLPNQKDEVRRKYLTRGPCQPYGHVFQKKKFGTTMRRFNPAWFEKYGNWLEYSVSKDKAFCLCCYLFRDDIPKQGGNYAFVTEGFSCWKKPEALSEHVGGINSFHNIAVKRCDDLMNQGQSIVHAFYKQGDVVKNEYRIRLNASVDASRYLLRQGLPFRGHDEGKDSANKGNFVELLKYTGEQNDAVSKVILENAPKNNQMVSQVIQKDIVHCFAQEVLKSIMEEIDHGVFGLMVDESADVSNKEQMAVVFRFVDKSGLVKERFVGVTHVKETSSLSLKSAVDDLFAKHGLSLKQLRGQGYDGASNMKGQFNGLRALVARENSSAYYVHCFAHQLQLVVVAVAKKSFEVSNFFDMVSTLLNVVVASCKRKDTLLDMNRKRVEEGIDSGDINTGTGQNQEISLPRPGNTRWGSHYKTLLRLVELFPSVIEILESVQDEGADDSKRCQAYGLLKYFHTFDCVFYLQLMLFILGVTENLSMALQMKNQDISNAMSLVDSTKRELQKFREDGWDLLIGKVSSFCEKNKATMLVMDEEFVDLRRPRKKTGVTNLHHYKVNCFYAVMDLQLQELNDRFTEVNTDLLICMASLSPANSFREFDKSKLLRLVKFYPDDFSFGECLSMEHHLGIYIDNIKNDERFKNLKNLGDLSRLMVETKKHLVHPLVYRLLKLVLTLPVATASVERCFSAMKLVKTATRNRIGDEFLSDCLVCYIEKELFESVTNETVVKRFQSMRERRIHL